MNENSKERDTEISKQKEYEDRANRVDELTNLVEKHTRTERHLEHHQHLGSPENVDHAREVQSEREEAIDTLKDKIVYGTGGPTDEYNNIKQRIEFADGYMDHNADTMNEEDLKNLKEKQENRKETLDEFGKFH